MPSPAVALAPTLDQVEADVVAIAATSSADGPALLAPDSLQGVREHLVAIGFTGKADELVRLPVVDGVDVPLAVVGLGATVSTTSLRRGAGSAIRQLAGAATVALAFGRDDEAEVAAIVEGASIGSYAFTAYRGRTASKQKAPVATVAVVTEAAVAEATLARIAAVDAQIRLVRDLTNRSGADLSPQALADAAIAAAEGTAVTVEVWDEQRLIAEGCGGIMGVGQGSSRPPRLIKLSYAPEGAAKHIALVGKGITYDTGGYSLKPAAAMSGMQNDMGGAAVSLGVVLAAAAIDLPVRLTAWLCVAENLVSSTAIRPNDVLTMRGGTTVEVMNTDAEGRLVMADGLVLASEEQPDAIIDVATLTGAQIVSLGHRTVGVMGDESVVAPIIAASAETGEPHWHMPLPDELRSLLDSRFADLQNLKLGNVAGGMLLAGVFLREFVGTRPDGTPIPWGHLDIAGPAVNEGPAYGYLAEGATGVSVRTLLLAIERTYAS